MSLDLICINDLLTRSCQRSRQRAGEMAAVMMKRNGGAHSAWQKSSRPFLATGSATLTRPCSGRSKKGQRQAAPAEGARRPCPRCPRCPSRPRCPRHTRTVAGGQSCAGSLEVLARRRLRALPRCAHMSLTGTGNFPLRAHATHAARTRRTPHARGNQCCACHDDRPQAATRQH